jgi:anti-sigma factor RsiW
VQICLEITALLSDYLDRDLPAGSCLTIEEHLRSCAKCEATLVGLKNTVAVCRQFRSKDEPGPLAEEKRQALRTAFEKALDSMRRGDIE